MAENEKVLFTFKDAPKGKSGTDISSGKYQNEYITELQGVDAAITYNKMRRNNPQIRKILSAIRSPIRNASWTISPISDEEKDIKIASALNHILFNDGKFTSKLDEITTFLIHGYSVFEPISMNAQTKEFGPLTTIKSLAFRAQESIDEWKHDEATGELLEVHQVQQGDVSVDVWIPRNELLIFFNEKEGDDNGFSLLRPLYPPYKRQNMIETIKMIGIERFAIPSPKLKVPATVSPADEEYLAAITILENYCSGESSYLTFPNGWELDLFSNNGFDPNKLEDSIKRENEKMAGAILATFLELGTGGNAGAFALSENLERFFTLVIGSFAKNIVDTINNDLLPYYFQANFGEDLELMPKLNVSGITDRVGKEFMEIVTGFTSAQIITPDETLEDYIRERFELPKKAEGSVMDNQTSEDTPPADESSDDQSDETQDDVGGDDETTQLSEAIKLEDTARKIIIDESKHVADVMKNNIDFMSEKLIATVVNRYAKLPASKKLDALSEINVGGVAKYRRQLKGALTTAANRSFERTLEELGLSDLELSENIEMSKKLDEQLIGIKFEEQNFSKLPLHVQKLLTAQSSLISERHANEIKDRVAFVYMNNENADLTEREMKKLLTDELANYSASGKIATGATTTTSLISNQVRLDMFFDKDVQDKIYAFRFSNVSPVAPICKKLNGRIISKDDPALFEYTPPLHWNCKSYLTPIMNTAKSKPKITGLPTLTEQEVKSINLSETCTCN